MFSRSHKHIKGQVLVHWESAAVRPSLLEDLLFASEFIDFMKHQKILLAQKDKIAH